MKWMVEENGVSLLSFPVFRKLSKHANNLNHVVYVLLGISPASEV